MLLVVALASTSLAQGEARQPIPLPDGYRVTNVVRLVQGVTHYRVEGRDQRINVAQIAPGAPVRARVAVARQDIGPDGGRQRTSSMCAVYDCLVGVNGDFFYGEGRPAGAVVIAGEPWITPRYRRPHMMIGDDGYQVGKLEIPIRIVVRYPQPVEPLDELLGLNNAKDQRRPIRLDGVNSERGRDALIVYTSRRGARTGTSRSGVDVVARIVSKPRRLLLRSESTIELVKLVPKGNARIPDGGIVLSGRGHAGERLRDLWEDVRAGDARARMVVSVGGPAAKHVIAGRPVLVREGELEPQDDDWFSYAPHARTVVGWKDDGTLYLVTIDRSRGTRGMSLNEAARFMRRLGVEAALNLDGGGSTTFVRRGTVRNVPPGSERSVGNALLIVAA